MAGDKAPVIPLHLHPGFQERQRVKELKTMLMMEPWLTSRWPWTQPGPRLGR